ncbi:MAG: hypothetical protein HFG37_09080 [Eubacterium sp.]|nr:hypothetical protein [Eubacterium sp.]
MAKFLSYEDRLEIAYRHQGACCNPNKCGGLRKQCIDFARYVVRVWSESADNMCSGLPAELGIRF